MKVMQINWGWEKIVEVLLPLCLLAQILLPVYFIPVKLVCFLLAPTEEGDTGDDVSNMWFTKGRSAGPGISTTVSFAVFFSLCLAPLGYLVWSTWWVARCHKPVSAPITLPMQVEAKEGPASWQRRFCSRCNIAQGDRVYHCRFLGVCLPFYDHQCPWFLGVVWLHNIKAYLMFIVFFPLFQLYCLAISIWAVAQDWRHGNLHLVAGIFTALFMIPSCWFSQTMLRGFLLSNTLAQESGKLKVIYLRTSHNHVYEWNAAEAPANSPWNVGWRQNAFMMLGPVWSWLFFWTQTPLMKNFDQLRLNGLPSATIQLETLPGTRRVEITSRRIGGDVENQSNSSLRLRENTSSSSESPLPDSTQQGS